MTILICRLPGNSSSFLRKKVQQREECLYPVAVPEISCSLFACELSTVAIRSSLHQRHSGRSTDSNLRFSPFSVTGTKKARPRWGRAFLAYTTQFDTMQRKRAERCIRQIIDSLYQK